jgi:uncharacterized protein
VPTLDPVILFFLLGVLGGLMRSDIRLPEALYEALSIFLLIVIGLKGGVELAQQPLGHIAPQILAVIGMGVVLTLLAYGVLSVSGRFKFEDSAAIAAHYGSVSIGTYAVAVAYLMSAGIPHEQYMPLFVVVLEIPAIMIGIYLVRRRGSAGTGSGSTRDVVQEVFLGKSILLLTGGLLIGWIAGPEGIEPLAPAFFDPFKGALALFLLEMGVVAASRLQDLRKTGFVLVAFGVGFPLLGALIGTALGYALGLSMGGTILLATLAASASYIAAPAAMRIAVPKASPTLSLTAALGITFPFNVLIGIPLYAALATLVYGSGSAT